MIGGGGGTPGGTSAGLFLPPNQAGAAQGFQDLTTPLQQQGINAFNMMGGQSPAQWAWPYVNQAGMNIGSNPYTGQAVTGGVMAGDIFQNQMMPQGMAAGGQLNYLGNLMAAQAGGIPAMMNNPAYAQAGQLGQQLSPQYASAAGNILNTAFDPQRQLYDRTLQQIMDQQNAINARSGVASTPYGAGIAGQRAQDFNIDWQNQQLQRQALGGQAASALGNEAMKSLLLGPNAQLAAQAAGTNILGDLTRGAGTGLLGAQGMYGGLAQAAPGMMGAAYNAYNTPQQNNLAALQNMIGLGNAMYQPGQQAVSNLGQYMGLGQNASQIANAIGSTNFNQANQLGSGLMQGLGALGNSNLLFGSGGISNALGLGSGGLFGSLFGGGAGAGTSAAGLFGGGEGAGAGLFSLFDAAPELSLAFGLSDRRFKTDIERLGQLDYGPAIYSFKYKGSDQPQIGLMADEVEVFNPEAVLRDARDIAYVDYSRALRP